MEHQEPTELVCQPWSLPLGVAMSLGASASRWRRVHSDAAGRGARRGRDGMWPTARRYGRRSAGTTRATQVPPAHSVPPTRPAVNRAPPWVGRDDVRVRARQTRPLAKRRDMAGATLCWCPTPGTVRKRCRHCGRPVTLGLSEWTPDTPGRTQTWTCPHCRAMNTEELPGRVLWALSRQSD